MLRAACLRPERNIHLATFSRRWGTTYEGKYRVKRFVIDGDEQIFQFFTIDKQKGIVHEAYNWKRAGKVWKMNNRREKRRDEFRKYLTSTRKLREPTQCKIKMRKANWMKFARGIIRNLSLFVNCQTSYDITALVNKV